MVKTREPATPVTPSSGNVFDDLGLAEPEEELTKAQLASHIRQVIKRQRLTQVAAAALMGIPRDPGARLRMGRPGDGQAAAGTRPWSFLPGPRRDQTTTGPTHRA